MSQESEVEAERQWVKKSHLDQETRRRKGVEGRQNSLCKGLEAGRSLILPSHSLSGSRLRWEGARFWIQTPWGQIPSVLLSSWVSLQVASHDSASVFPGCKMGMMITMVTLTAVVPSSQSCGD